jgi:alpha-mannosidase
VAVLDTVKLAEDNDNRLVLRLYEAAGGRGDVQVSLPFTAQHVTLADILERPLPDDGSLKWHHPTNQLTLSFKPFEVKTLLLDL